MQRKTDTKPQRLRTMSSRNRLSNEEIIHFTVIVRCTKEKHFKKNSKSQHTYRDTDIQRHRGHRKIVSNGTTAKKNQIKCNN